MTKKETISLKKAREVFPKLPMRLRPHDLISISIDKKKFMTKKEQEKLQGLAFRIKGGLFRDKMDILATRKRKQIKFEPF